jgi:hypothetical protein
MILIVGLCVAKNFVLILELYKYNAACFNYPHYVASYSITIVWMMDWYICGMQYTFLLWDTIIAFEVSEVNSEKDRQDNQFPGRVQNWELPDIKQECYFFSCNVWSNTTFLEMNTIGCSHYRVKDQSFDTTITFQLFS